MRKTLIINDTEIEYRLRRSKRSKRLRLCLYPDSSIIVSLPLRTKESLAENFVREKAVWLLEKLAKLKKSGYTALRQAGQDEYLKHKDAALSFVRERLEILNKAYDFRYEKISVKNQKSRWGSCSRKGNLNFNFRLFFLAPRIADYVMVHELCHLREFNHSSRFWKLVALSFPDYLELRRELGKGALRQEL